MKRKQKQAQPVKLFMLLYNWTASPTWENSERFTFHAHDQADADEKAGGWARYHSFDLRTVKAREATQEEQNRPGWIHDEYVD